MLSFGRNVYGFKFYGFFIHKLKSVNVLDKVVDCVSSLVTERVVNVGINEIYRSEISPWIAGTRLLQSEHCIWQRHVSTRRKEIPILTVLNAT